MLGLWRVGLRALTKTPAEYLALASLPQAQSPDQLSWLSTNLPYFSTAQFIALLRSHSPHTLSPALAPLLQFETFSRLQAAKFRNWTLLFHLSRLSERYEELGISLVPAFQALTKEHLSKQFLKSMSLTQAQQILSAHLHLLYPAKIKDLSFPTPSGQDLFDLASEVLAPAMSSASDASLPEWYNILRVYILGDKGSEDFRRGLESLVFERLAALPLHTLVDLPFLYKDRMCFDYHYIMTKVTGPYVQEVVRRFHLLDARQVGLVSYRLWWSLGKYGVYYSAEFTDKLVQRVSDQAWLALTAPRNQVYFASNVLIYLCNVGLPFGPVLLDRLLDLLLQHRTYLDAKQVAQLCHAVARLHCVREDFWALVTSHIPAIVQDERHSGYLYSALLQLRFAQPALHSRLMALPEMQASFPTLTTVWKQQRTKDLTLAKESFQTKQVEAFLSARQVKYQMEYFDEYYIDVAVPELKLALEICGTMHYIMPMKVLNGKTQAKKYVLEQLGWQVVIIPFFHQGVEGRFEQVLDDTLGPILPPSS